MEKEEKHNRQKADRIYSVCLEGLEFRAFHGCREDEKVNGNTFRVNLRGEFVSAAGSTDNLDDTVNYGAVYRKVAAVMLGSRRNLLEALSADIIEGVHEEFPQFTSLEVSVGKKNPPVDGPCDWSWISTKWNDKQ